MKDSLKWTAHSNWQGKLMFPLSVYLKKNVNIKIWTFSRLNIIKEMTYSSLK